MSKEYGCEGYDAIARVYEQMGAPIDYEAWADFFEACFEKFLAKRPELLLDLACGTGRMTRALAARGYDMIGVDGSGEMLSEAYAQKTADDGILYLCQDMRNFELYGTVGAVVCCLDSINYLLTEEDVQKTFRTVHNYLDPDGLFLFDLNTPHKFETVYGNEAYILEDENSFLGWQNEYDKESGICDFYLTLFEEDEDGRYDRSEEHQQERCYQRETITRLLEKNGFELIGFFSDFDFSTPTDTTDRWYIAARAKK
ncbi:MAG: class I SAM-dependent methyltransferase [Clostridia bacterium]|nr:class I SAM-dependent methyltransferase [Clostridia bacterium]